jgi:hypothetical protein
MNQRREASEKDILDILDAKKISNEEYQRKVFRVIGCVQRELRSAFERVIQSGDGYKLNGLDKDSHFLGYLEYLVSPTLNYWEGIISAMQKGKGVSHSSLVGLILGGPKFKNLVRDYIRRQKTSKQSSPETISYSWEENENKYLNDHSKAAAKIEDEAEGKKSVEETLTMLENAINQLENEEVRKVTLLQYAPLLCKHSKDLVEIEILPEEKTKEYDDIYMNIQEKLKNNTSDRVLLSEAQIASLLENEITIPGYSIMSEKKLSEEKKVYVRDKFRVSKRKLPELLVKMARNSSHEEN